MYKTSNFKDITYLCQAIDIRHSFSTTTATQTF